MPVKPAEPVFRRDLFDLPETHRPDEQQPG
jgi:hypothetical protein